MYLTFKIRHNIDFSRELSIAKQVAEFAIQNRKATTKHVKHLGLKSIISNQILRKYSRNKKCKKVHSTKLAIPKQGIKFDQQAQIIKVPCLKLLFSTKTVHKPILDVKYIEIDDSFFYCCCLVHDQPITEHTNCIGIDLNSTGHAVVAANPKTGKVLKLGKKIWHTHKKYKNIRKKLQKKKKLKELKKIKDRESRIIRDLNHKISRKIVNWAKENHANINLENLKGIRKNTKGKKNLSYNLNSWSFYQLRQMIEYKAKLLGIVVNLIDPKYTSKICSKTGLLGDRKGKVFKSPNGVEHSDVNAAFNIACSIGDRQRYRQERL